MSSLSFIRLPVAALTVGLAMHTYAPGCRASGGNKQISPGQQERLEAMRSDLSDRLAETVQRFNLALRSSDIIVFARASS